MRLESGESDFADELNCRQCPVRGDSPVETQANKILSSVTAAYSADHPNNVALTAFENSFDLDPKMSARKGSGPSESPLSTIKGQLSPGCFLNSLHKAQGLLSNAFATRKVFNWPPHPPTHFSGGRGVVAQRLADRDGGGMVHAASCLDAWWNDSRQRRWLRDCRHRSRKSGNGLRCGARSGPGDRD